MHRGYIKIWRRIQDSFINQDSEAFHLFCTLIMLANYKDNEFMFNGKKMLCKRGQFITGVSKLSLITGISRSKVFRLLKCFKNETLIEMINMHRFSLISIVCYDDYQSNETINETPVKRKRNASETLVNTNKNDKNDKNDKNEKERTFSSPSLDDVSKYCVERQNTIDPSKFIDFYESKGWMIGKNKMKDWKASVRTWEKRDTALVKPARNPLTPEQIRNSH